MKKAEKLKEIEALWRGWNREVPWEGINWETGEYDGPELQPELQTHLVEEIAKDIKNKGFFMWVYTMKEEASGWITWDYCLASFLYSWLQQPEECLWPLFWDEAAGVLIIPESEIAMRLASLFKGPHSFTLGIEGLSEVLKARPELDAANWGTVIAKSDLTAKARTEAGAS